MKLRCPSVFCVEVCGKVPVKLRIVSWILRSAPHRSLRGVCDFVAKAFDGDLGVMVFRMPMRFRE